MEYIEAQTAQELVDREGPLPPSQALSLAGQAAMALAAASCEGLVHRDIEPSSLMISGDSREGADGPTVKLIDIGLSQGAGVDTSLQRGASKNSPYASPEQIEGRGMDERSDVYSLGCTLWFLLTGKPPFADSLASMMPSIDREPAWRHLENVPKEVRRLLRIMLRNDPEKRPRDGLEAQSAIERCLAKIRTRRWPAIHFPMLGRRIQDSWPTHPRATACAAIFLAAAWAYSRMSNEPSAHLLPWANQAAAADLTARAASSGREVRPGRFHLVASDVVVTPTKGATAATPSVEPDPAQRLADGSSDVTSETVPPDPVAAPPSDEDIDSPAVAGSTSDKGKTAPKMPPAKRRHHSLAAQKPANPLSKFNQTMHDLLARIF